MDEYVGIGWGVFIVVMFLIFLVPLLFGVVLLREAYKTKSVAKLILAGLSLALFGWLMVNETTRMLFLGVFSLGL